MYLALKDLLLFEQLLSYKDLIYFCYISVNSTSTVRVSN